METTMNINLENLNISNVRHHNIDNIILTPAERVYAQMKKAVSRYQKKNPEKCRLKNKTYMKNMKDNKPDEYALFLEAKKQYYLTITKPKNQEKQRLKKEMREKVRLAMEQDEIRSLDGINDYESE